MIDYQDMMKCLHKGVAEPEQQWSAYDLIEELKAANHGLVRLNEATEARAKTAEAKLAEYKHVASAIDTQWAESQDEIADLKAKLATCKKYRDAYAECDRIATQDVRDLEAKLAKAVDALGEAIYLLDLGEDEETASTAGSGSIVSALKRSNTSVSADDPGEGAAAPKIRAETDSTKLRQFLNNLGGDE